MYTVKLPVIDWFACGNVYSGSFQPDPSVGSLSQTTFSYKVKMQAAHNEKHLFAICYYTLPWNQHSNIEEAFCAKFEASNFGIEVCENWIHSKFIIDDMPQLPAA